MKEVIAKIASVIVNAINTNLTADGECFNLWQVIMTYFLCGLVGYILYLLIRAIADMGEE